METGYDGDLPEDVRLTWTAMDEIKARRLQWRRRRAVELAVQVAKPKRVLDTLFPATLPLVSTHPTLPFSLPFTAVNNPVMPHSAYAAAMFGGSGQRTQQPVWSAWSSLPAAVRF
jgi:hypothetical protein